MSKKITVYIVEDYVLSRMNLVCTLADKFEVLGHFKTAEECIDAICEKPSDIVIMDIGLPMMNGIEATKRIKLHFPDTKVVIFSSYEEIEVIKAALSCGSNAYCTKEMDLNSLPTILNIVNDGALWLDPKIAKTMNEIVPKPISTDFRNLYPKKKLCANLTEREREVLELIVLGKTNPQIAEAFFISKNTAKAHVCHIMKKLCVTNRFEVIAKALKDGLVDNIE